MILRHTAVKHILIMVKQKVSSKENIFKNTTNQIYLLI